MDTPRLSAGAVEEIGERPDGPVPMQPVLQVLTVRPVSNASAEAPGAAQKSDRFRMKLSDGIHKHQSMLGTPLNHLVWDGAIRAGSVVHLREMTCNTILERRIIIVLKLDVLQSECAKIGDPKPYVKKSLPETLEPNLLANATQTNNGTYSIGPGFPGSSVAPRAEQVANNPSYGGPYNGFQGTVSSAIGRPVQPGPNNVLSGRSYGTMSAQTTVNINVMQPKPQQPLLNSHQNHSFTVPASGGGFGSPGNTYGCSAQPSFQQPPSASMNRGPVARNAAAARVIPISALNPYQGGTIKARVTAKTGVKHFTKPNNSPGKLFSFDLLDAHGGEIRAASFDRDVDRFFDLIEVDKVYLISISMGSVKGANKKYNLLNNEYELSLNNFTSVEMCSGDDSSIPKLRFHFRQIGDIEDMGVNTIVDLLGIVTSVSPSGTITIKKSGNEIQKRTLQLKDMSGRSVEVTMWGRFCDAEGQQLQSLCDSGLNPVLAFKGARVSDFRGKCVGTPDSCLLKINPDIPEARRLSEWYATEGNSVVFVSLSQGISSMGGTDVRKTIGQIKDENLGHSDKPDWITVKGAISNLKTDNFCYPACTSKVDGNCCNKKVTDTGDGKWYCEKCDKNSEDHEYRYIMQCQIQDNTGATYATAFQEAGEQILGISAQKLFNMKSEDEAQFADIIQRMRSNLYLFKLKVKEETYNDEPRVKSIIVKAEELDPSKESCYLLGAIDSLLQDGSVSTPGMNGAVSLNAGYTNLEEVRQSVPTSNNAYAMNMGVANQFGRQASISGGVSDPPLATRDVQACSVCGSSGHNTQNCHAVTDRRQPQAGAGFTASSYSSSAGNSCSDLCFKCRHPGHHASNCPGQAARSVADSDLCYKCFLPGHSPRDCPRQASGLQGQIYGTGAVSAAYSRQSSVGSYN